ncbi:unnamed protein product [Peniophora sp. CBMAI 1063]|nr:unnamed protein product [Peniophora sp. CBMAI 1063]
MPSILNLKFKGNKSFIAFSNLGDTDSLTKTWKVCTKVAGYLEQGQRLENLSWRLWHLQNLMVDTDNAKSKREFKKLSKVMGDKLDKEKGRSIEELEAPGFRRTGSTDLLVARAHEKERSREAQQSARPGTIKRMQFTFSIDGPSEPAAAQHVDKPDLKPSAAFRRTGPRTARQPQQQPQEVVEQPLTQRGRKQSVSAPSAPAPIQEDEFAALRFPSYFSSDFGPAALLYAAPTLANGNSYGEGVRSSSTNYDAFAVSRPTIELGIDELMADTPPQDNEPAHSWAPMDYETAAPDTPTPATASAPAASTSATTTTMTPSATPSASTPKPSASVAPAKLATAPAGKPALSVRTGTVPAPGGQKAECSNCGATHTPLWRRGLNDELNCNACGLYCKLHKRPRPKTMRGQPAHARQVEASASASASTTGGPRVEPIEAIPVAQCYNCHTTATPLWRKDEEGKTVCNACGLYYKLHGSARPISMKSDVIRKRSRHDARRGSGPGETPSASPGASRRASPNNDGLTRSPTLAPDSSTAPWADQYGGLMYGYPAAEFGLSLSGTGPTQTDDEIEEEERAAKRRRLSTASSTYSTASGISSASGTEPPSSAISSASYATTAASSLASESYEAPKAFGSPGSNYGHGPGNGYDNGQSYGQPQGDANNSGYAQQQQPQQQQDANAVTNASGYAQDSNGNVYGPADFPGPRLEFPFSSFPAYGMLRAPGAGAWHPPLLPPTQSPTFVHPPMIPPEDALHIGAPALSPHAAFAQMGAGSGVSGGNGGNGQGGVGGGQGMEYEWQSHSWGGHQWGAAAKEGAKSEAQDGDALFNSFLQEPAGSAFAGGMWEAN